MRPFLAKESQSEVTTYDLLSVICHHGTAGSMKCLLLKNALIIACMFTIQNESTQTWSRDLFPSDPLSHAVAGGHYIAYCQNVINGQWYEFDDQYVTEVHETVVQNAEAYVLFYR